MITPQSEQHHSELSTLAYLIVEGLPSLVGEFFAVCGPETFAHKETRAAAEALRELAACDEVVDLAGVAKAMRDKGTLAAVGGAGFLSGVVQEYHNAILSTSRLMESANWLAAEHAKREAQRELATALRDIQAPNTNACEIAAKLRDTAAMLDGNMQPGKSSFNTLSGDDLLALPRPKWRVKGLFPQHGTAVIYGASRAGKTFTILDIALAIALEEEWFGWKTVRCDILYLGLESTWGLQGRLKAWSIDTGKALPENLRFLIESFDLGNKKHVKEISAIAPKNGVLIIDTLNRASPGADENSSRDMSAIIKSVDDISRAMNGLVILISHTGKDTTKGLRGHSSLFAALDASIEVARNGDTRSIKVEKVKEGTDGGKKFFRLKPVVIGTDEDGEDITSCVVESVDEGTVKTESKPLTKSQLYALESFHSALKKENTASIHVDAWRPHFYAGHFAETDDAKQKAFQRARKELVEIGKISVFNNSYSWTCQTDAGHVR